MFNILHKLNNRSIGNKNKLLEHAFNNIKKKNIYKILNNDEDNPSNILITEFLVFVLTNEGFLHIFNKNKTNQLDTINILEYNNNENIKSIYLNKPTNDIIIVSINTLDNYTHLYCYSINIEILNKCYIRNEININELNNHKKQIFNDYNIKYPGFIEFDNITNIAIVYESPEIYAIYNLKDYSKIIEITDLDILDMKSSPCKLLYYNMEIENKNKTNKFNIIINNDLICWDYKVKVVLNDINKNTLENKKEIWVPYGKNKNIDNSNNYIYIEFIENLNDYLFIKYEKYDCIVLNINNYSYKILPDSNKITAGDLMFIYNQNRFLFFNKDILLYDCKCNKLVNYNSKLLYPYSGQQYISSNKDNTVIISLCCKETNTSLYNACLEIIYLKTGEKVTIDNQNYDYDNPFNISSLYLDNDNLDIYIGFNTGDVYQIGN